MTTFINHVRSSIGLEVQNNQSASPSSATERLLAGVVFLRSGGRPGSRDSWTSCFDVEALLDRPSSEYIIGRDIHEIETQLRQMYAENAGCTRITRVDYCKELRSDQYHRWEIEKHPKLIDTGNIGMAEIARACAAHKKVLVPNDVLRNLGDGWAKKMEDEGYRSDRQVFRNCHLVWQNVASVKMRRYKETKKKVMIFMQPTLLGDPLDNLADALMPSEWPNRDLQEVLTLQTVCPIVYSKRMDADDVRKCEFDAYNGQWIKLPTKKAPQKLFALMELARRCGNAYFWRKSPGFKKVIEDLLPYIHGPESRGDEHWKKLCAWIRREARILKLKIPPKPKLPKEPKAPKKAKEKASGTAAAA